MLASRLRIAVVAHHVAPIRPPFVGGVESSTWYLARWLARAGHEVVMFAPDGSQVPGVEVRALALGVQVSAAARQDVSMPPDAFMSAHHAYQELMLELIEDSDGFDVVHLQSLHYLPVAMSQLLGVPTALTLHTPPTPWLEGALQSRRRASLHLNAVSKATARVWRPVRVHEVIPNGVDAGAWPLGPGGETAAWCGRMVREKAPHLAIAAAREAGLDLRLAGPIVDPAYFAAEVAPLLGAGAEYVGHLEHRELAVLLGSSAVAFVTPDWEEPFCLTAAEAMATGTPVAAFARGGLAEVVCEATGLLAPGGDVDALAAAALAVSELPRVAVRRSALARLGIDAMGRRYEAMFARLAAGTPVGAEALEAV
ncbi:MAG: glycosyltransferase [Solirubrobacteraceae bacterium]